MNKRNIEDYSIKVVNDFSAAHFISEISEGLHGHNFKVIVRVFGGLGENFMVLDFRDVEAVLAEICEEMDHKIIVPEKSKDIKIMKSEDSIELKLSDKKRYVFPKKDVVLLPIESNTTELIAYYIHSRLKKKISGKIKVTLTEKENYSAEFVG
jgi:6-pyruvoyltetrahydropterin/6-carboxytetrahydropterin synthase